MRLAVILLILLLWNNPLNSEGPYDFNSYSKQYNTWTEMVIRRISEGDQIVNLNEFKEWEKTKEQWKVFEIKIDKLYKEQLAK